MPSFIKFLILIGFNLVIISLLCFGFELYLRLTDPFLRLPFDTLYYKRHQDHYPNLKVSPDDLRNDVTWGHPVINNNFGFRERELDQPKSRDSCRIVVLGDSFTWGIGLAVKERYAYRVEAQLLQAFPGRKFEVISWAISGWSTAKERDALRDYKAWLNPDIVVVGFVMNDLQPLPHDYTAEKEAFYDQYGKVINAVWTNLNQVGFSQTTQTLKDALDNFLVWSGILPPWEKGMQRTYERDSAEWQAFEQALRDIKRMTEEMNQPAPLFIVLNQDNFWDRPTEYTNLDSALPVYLRWYHQAEQAAVQAGFRTYNHEKELLKHVRREEIPVNELDYHPSARVNQIYGDKLFATLAEEIRQGRLCPPDKVQGAEPATPAPLADKRLLSIKFGTQIRFLGYVTQRQSQGQEQTLHLTLGWQAIEEIEVSYRIVLELVDAEGKIWHRQEELPCRGDCLTLFWPEGLIAPPDSEIVYWPEEAEVLPVSLEELPFQKALRDTHLLALGAHIPAGEYLLTLGLYDRDKGRYLSAFDEIGNASPLADRVILGTIILAE